MPRKFLLLFLLVLSLLLPGGAPWAPVAQAQQTHTVYLPLVGSSRASIDAAPADALPGESLTFVPLAEVEAANSGSTTISCTWNQGVSVHWWVNAAGILTTQWLYINATGQYTTVYRTFAAPGQGLIQAYMPGPGVGKRWIRVIWNYTASAAVVTNRCG